MKGGEGRDPGRGRLAAAAILTLLFAGAAAAAGLVLWTADRARRAKLPPTVGNFPSVRRRLENPPKGRYTFAVVGDTRGMGTYDSLVRIVRNEPFAFMVNLGDFAGNPTEREHRFFRLEMAQEVLTPYPVFLIPGNHDVSGEGFDLADFERNYGPSQFYFRYGPDLFVFLRYVRTWPGRSAEKFLETVLRRERPSARYAFVFTHTPLAGFANSEKADLEVSSRLVSLLEKYRVTYAFAGDLHGYRRLERNGVRYIVTGGGGAHLDRESPYGQFHHALALDVRRSGIGERILRIPRPLALSDHLERWAIVAAAPLLARYRYLFSLGALLWLALVVFSWRAVFVARGRSRGRSGAGAAPGGGQP